ncbi:MAG TPA: MFS transporter [Anaerolineae bacterium]
MSIGTAKQNPTGAPGGRLWTRNFSLVCVTALVYSLGFQFLLPILPMYMKSFGGTDSDVGLIFGTYSVAGLTSRMVAGWGIDRFGRKSLLVIAAFINFVGMPLYIIAASVPGLAFLRLFHGLAIGILTTVVPVLVADLVPPARRGEGLGYYGLAQSVSSAIGPGIAIWLIAAKGFPLAGFTLLFAACTIIGALTLLLALFVHETRSPQHTLAAWPKFRWSMVFNRSALPLMTTLCFVTFAQGSVMSFAALYLATDNPANVSIYFMVSAITMLISRPVVGSISDRVNRRYVIIPLIACCAIGVSIFAISPSLPAAIAAGIVWGTGFGSLNATLLALAVDMVKPTERGAALATVQSALDIGMGIGSMGLAYVAQIAGYHVMFGVASLSCVLGLSYFLYYMRTSRRPAIIVAENASAVDAHEVSTSTAES